MIAKEEIDGLAGELQVNPADIERDYVFGWLLAKIYGGSPLGSRLILKGGNALRKAYFPNTRYSNDLDFTTEGGFDPNELKTQLVGVCDAAAAATGVRFDNDRAQVKDKSFEKEIQILEARLYFYDFYGKPSDIVLKTKLDITEYERLVLAPVDRPMIHPYSDADKCGSTIRCVALEEVLASKLKCLLQRRQAQDLFDYVHWLAFGSEQASFAEVLRVFLQKTIYAASPGAALGLLLGLPFQLIKGFWNGHISSPLASVLSFEDAVDRFMKHLRTLFQGYSEDESWHSKGLYFPPELRNVIVEAGSLQTLVRMTYDGTSRLVEPYSLKFKKRKDGLAREYFYCHKLSGGSSPPGIQSLVADKCEFAEVTDTPFTPRYLIEVSKAGDVSQAGRFSNRRPIPAFGMTRPRRRASNLKYMFRCSSCHRLFARVSYDSSTRPHKRRGGSQCSGSFASYVGTRY